VRAACQVLGVGELRTYRWLGRRAADQLADQAPGGSPMHGLLEWEVAEIVRLFEAWGEVDRSHRKLAHRGSDWVGCGCRRPACAACWSTRACGCGRCPDRAAASASRSRTGSTTSQGRSGSTTRPTSPALGWPRPWSRTWSAASGWPRSSRSRRPPPRSRWRSPRRWNARGLAELVSARQDGLVDPHRGRPCPAGAAGPQRQRPADDLRLDQGVHGLVRHPPALRPPRHPDQAWIESLFGHVKAEWPHLTAIRDPATLRAELAVVRERYNGVRLHAGIGYVTPNDEHQGRGPAIRKARQAGLEQARLQRLAWQREHRQPEPSQEPGDVGSSIHDLYRELRNRSPRNRPDPTHARGSMAIGRRVVPTRYGDYDLPAGRIDKVRRRALLDLLVGLFVPASERAARRVSLPLWDVSVTRPCCTAPPACDRWPCPRRTGRLRPRRP
jgi:putative transposase